MRSRITSILTSVTYARYLIRYASFDLLRPQEYGKDIGRPLKLNWTSLVLMGKPSPKERPSIYGYLHPALLSSVRTVRSPLKYDNEVARKSPTPRFTVSLVSRSTNHMVLGTQLCSTLIANEVPTEKHISASIRKILYIGSAVSNGSAVH